MVESQRTTGSSSGKEPASQRERESMSRGKHKVENSGLAVKEKEPILELPTFTESLRDVVALLGIA